jgi:hypothetical protein
MVAPTTKRARLMVGTRDAVGEGQAPAQAARAANEKQEPPRGAA